MSRRGRGRWHLQELKGPLPHHGPALARLAPLDHRRELGLQRAASGGRPARDRAELVGDHAQIGGWIGARPVGDGGRPRLQRVEGDLAHADAELADAFERAAEQVERADEVEQRERARLDVEAAEAAGEVLVAREVRGDAARREAEAHLVDVQDDRRDHRDEQVGHRLAGAEAVRLVGAHAARQVLEQQARAGGAQREVDGDARDVQVVEDHLGRTRAARHRPDERPLPVLLRGGGAGALVETEHLEQPRALDEAQYVADEVLLEAERQRLQVDLRVARVGGSVGGGEAEEAGSERDGARGGAAAEMKGAARAAARASSAVK